uniref:Uncharacterized protein n=1 Tax=Trichuris muris TaxID=70415 RepID=A0A5S6QBB2_TRIMR
MFKSRGIYRFSYNACSYNAFSLIRDFEIVALSHITRFCFRSYAISPAGKRGRMAKSTRVFIHREQTKAALLAYARSSVMNKRNVTKTFRILIRSSVRPSCAPCDMHTQTGY